MTPLTILIYLLIIFIILFFIYRNFFKPPKYKSNGGILPIALTVKPILNGVIKMIGKNPKLIDGICKMLQKIKDPECNVETLINTFINDYGKELQTSNNLRGLL